MSSKQALVEVASITAEDEEEGYSIVDTLTSRKAKELELHDSFDDEVDVVVSMPAKAPAKASVTMGPEESKQITHGRLSRMMFSKPSKEPELKKEAPKSSGPKTS